jgi:hypothetical protein
MLVPAREASFSAAGKPRAPDPEACGLRYLLECKVNSFAKTSFTISTSMGWQLGGYSSGPGRWEDFRSVDRHQDFALAGFSMDGGEIAR